MDELEYRVVFKDGTHGVWFCRSVNILGDVIKLRLELDAPGEILTMQIRVPDKHCLRCELAVEDLGLCFKHLNDELDAQDPWPDYTDQGYWNTQQEWEPS